ncbi:MAG: DUF1501 domain-containing protein [Burkholderiales bacterium]|nr:DUF1501 domain-containing protein [Burkholderiales bacterium]
MTYLHKNASRREFLRRSAAIGAAAGSPFALNLAAIGSAAAQSASGYKALVCVYLGGGNDSGNTVVPRGAAEYTPYASARGSIALPQGNLLPISPTAYNGPALGLHPALTRVRDLVNQGRCAVLANVGTLAYPMPLGRDNWNGGNPNVPVPYQLFSHSDQTGQWQTGIPDAPSRTGWMGRMGDLFAAPASGVSMAMSMAGNNTLQVGNQVVQYQLTTAGPVRIRSLDQLYWSANSTLRTLITEERTHLMERELARIARRSIQAESVVSAAIQPTSSLPAFPGGGIGAQLRMVARMIAARAALGQTRQIFYVMHGGYDFHANLLNDQNARLTELDAALGQFYQSTLDLGVADSVTTFTASDFGRALQYNGDGSDHGWGGHHFIIGGSVRGNRVFGQWPIVALNSRDDAGRGSMIPTTAVDQYAATLATWFGVSPSNLPLVLPNIGRFASSNLGFLA